MFRRRTKDYDLYKTNKMNRFAWVMFVIMSIYAILILFPYAFALFASFKSVADFSDNPFGISVPTLSAYTKMLKSFVYPVLMKDGSAGYYDFLGLTINSFLFASGRAFIGTMTPCVVSYCAARFDFKIGKFLTDLVYVLLTVGLIGTTGASIEMTQRLGLYDNMIGMYVLSASFLGMQYLYYYGNWKTIPSDFSEAAIMDGAGNFTIFFRIMFPMVRSLFSLNLITGFIGHWGDYGTPLFYMPSTPTLALAMFNFNELYSTSVTMQLAGCLMLSIPGLILFLVGKKYFVGNMQLGGIKG